MARPTHHTIHAPPSTPKTPAAIGNHAEDGASRHQAAQQEEEGQAADWTVFSAQGLHMDQSMLAQAHAAMLTIESEGARLQLLPTPLHVPSCTRLRTLP